MAEEFIDVWVEIFSSAEDDSSSGRRSSVKSAEASKFRRGKVAKDAFLAADLMRKAQQSRKAAEDAIKGSSSHHGEKQHKRWGTDGALQKVSSIIIS